MRCLLEIKIDKAEKTGFSFLILHHSNGSFPVDFSNR